MLIDLKFTYLKFLSKVSTCHTNQIKTVLAVIIPLKCKRCMNKIWSPLSLQCYRPVLEHQQHSRQCLVSFNPGSVSEFVKNAHKNRNNHFRTNCVSQQQFYRVPSHFSYICLSTPVLYKFKNFIQTRTNLIICQKVWANYHIPCDPLVAFPVFISCLLPYEHSSFL